MRVLPLTSHHNLLHIFIVYVITLQLLDSIFAFTLGPRALAVPDPDLEIRVCVAGRGGVSHPDPYIVKGGGVAVSKKIFFRSFGPQFGVLIAGSPAPWAPPLDPPLTSTRVPAVNGIVLTPTGFPICNGVHINAPVMQRSGLPRN